MAQHGARQGVLSAPGVGLIHRRAARGSVAFIAAESAKEFVDALERPRRLVIMVKAGEPTDAVIREFAPLLEEGDVIIDGGNAHFEDTRRRERELRERGIHFVGVGRRGRLRARRLGHADLRAASRTLGGPSASPLPQAEADAFAARVEQALYASKIVSYTQRFHRIQAGSAEYGWAVDPGAVASLWRGGCIIRAAFLDRIRAAYDARPDLLSLPADERFAEEIGAAQDDWRDVLATAVRQGAPVPAFAASLAYYDPLRADRLPAALTQGRRDYFGAHTCRRTDRGARSTPSGAVTAARSGPTEGQWPGPAPGVVVLGLRLRSAEGAGLREGCGPRRRRDRVRFRDGAGHGRRGRGNRLRSGRAGVGPARVRPGAGEGIRYPRLRYSGLRYWLHPGGRARHGVRLGHGRGVGLRHRSGGLVLCVSHHKPHLPAIRDATPAGARRPPPRARPRDWSAAVPAS